MSAVCVDTGALRRSADLSRLVTATEKKFVVTDGSVMELCKSSHWVKTLQDSLRILSAVPERVFFTLGNGELIGAEIEYRRSLSLSDLVSDAFTYRMRALLKEVAKGAPGQAFDKMREVVSSGNERVSKGHLNHEKNREMLLNLVPTIRQCISMETTTRLRNGQLSGEDIRAMVTEVVSELLPKLSPPPAPPHVVLEWIKERSFMFRWVWLRTRTIVQWIEKGGVESVRAEKVTNSDIDRQILVVGSYCSRILTEDREMQKLDADLRAVVGSTGQL